MAILSYKGVWEATHEFLFYFLFFQLHEEDYYLSLIIAGYDVIDFFDFKRTDFYECNKVKFYVKKIMLSVTQFLRKKQIPAVPLLIIPVEKQRTILTSILITCSIFQNTE